MKKTIFTFLIAVLTISTSSICLAEQPTYKIDSKELRYIKSMVDRGNEYEAMEKLLEIMETSKDEALLAESMYLAIEWDIAEDTIDIYNKLRFYYPDSKYASLAKKKFEDPVSGAQAMKWHKGLITYDKDLLLDTNTGLMWKKGTSGKDMGWRDAKEYCENYEGGGHTDWRMPTGDELKSLHIHLKYLRMSLKGSYDRNFYHIADGLYDLFEDSWITHTVKDNRWNHSHVIPVRDAK